MILTTHKLQRWLSPLKSTPLHPQWLVLRHRTDLVKWLNQYAKGILVDIGCGNGLLKQKISDLDQYIGIDYPKTVALGYSGNPDIFADASKLPFTNSSVDTVLLFDILEHVPEPDQTIGEVARILSKDGKCLIHVPFLYPLHDEPFDYQRWTKHGLRRLLEFHNLKIVEMSESTSSIETATALFAIALAKGVLDSIHKRKLGMLVIPLVLVFVPVVNIVGWMLGKLLPRADFMPFSYRLVASPGDGGLDEI